MFRSFAQSRRKAKSAGNKPDIVALRTALISDPDVDSKPVGESKRINTKNHFYTILSSSLDPTQAGRQSEAGVPD